MSCFRREGALEKLAMLREERQASPPKKPKARKIIVSDEEG